MMCGSRVIEAPAQVKPARILHLEDKKADRELVREIIEGAGIDCEIVGVEARADYESRLGNEDWDLILSDYSLPAFDGLTALSIAVETCPNTPFIFVTGTMGEDTAVESLKNGATDYVLKERMTRLGGAVVRALNEREERLQRRRAEEDLKRSEEQLRFMAFHDPLTGLPNRDLFDDRLEQAISSARRDGEKIALLFIDLDNFKFVNDSLGHSAGDRVLIDVAERLKKCMREGDTVARLGGDEFVVIVSPAKDGTEGVIAADRIRRVVAAEIKVSGILISTTCSVGISIFPDDGEDRETLLKNADAALFRAKDAGRNTWQFFVPDMNGRALERLTMENSLRHAIANDQLFLEYQPQLELSSGRIAGAEALVRWRHPELGVVAPNVFIPLAESTGEIIAIGRWVLRTACTQARRWLDEGIAPLSMAVNVSAIQIHHEPFAFVIKEILEESGLPPECLELEVTESLMLSNADMMTFLFRELSGLKVRLAVDDFGTGYCGLAYLIDSRFNRLKIDQSFINAISHSSDNAALTAAIINLAKSLHMRVIAECVETKGQCEFLRSHGCDEIQGFYFSRPLSASAFTEKFRKHAAQLQV